MNKHIKVWVQAPTLGVHHIFRDKGFDVAWEDIGWEKHDPDLLVFCGGADISPELYGQRNVRSGTNVARDKREIELWEYGMSKGIPMLGICRGGQLLNVLNGGSMWQDASIHARGVTHDIIDTRTGNVHQTNSHHHQIMRAGKSAELIAIHEMLPIDRKTDDRGTFGYEDLTAGERHNHEVLFYPETNSLCFQGHPEFGTMPAEGGKYFWSLVKEKFECVV